MGRRQEERWVNAKVSLSGWGLSCDMPGPQGVPSCLGDRRLGVLMVRGMDQGWVWLAVDWGQPT